MIYRSTRDVTARLTGAEAILRGLSAEGGLFVPESLPAVSHDAIGALCGMDYTARAEYVLGLFLDDYTPKQVKSCAEAAYGEGFDRCGPAPVTKLPDGRFVLELFHGPTCAFKDMALQLLPHLMGSAAANTGKTTRTLILVATSGDTGKAALEGFRDAEGIKIMVFYPADGVSPLQKLQMTTQEGDNVAVCAVKGNFDNTQSGVKAIFASEAMQHFLAEHNTTFSSANSINWGRLLPQIIYYFSAYADLVAANEIAMGERVNFAVPTGNFGNILAAYYAKGMGLPVGRLICASNENRVLADFIETGRYSLDRDFHLTLSPSMDILISSNLERLLFHLLGEDDTALRGLMNALSERGEYAVPNAVLTALQDQFYGGSCDDIRTTETIKAVFQGQNYLLDTHTAVAVAVANDYHEATGDTAKTVIVSTASPYKFAGSVYSALTGETESDEFKAVEKLHALTGVAIPAPLDGLRGKPVRFEQVVDKTAMPDAVKNFV